MQFLCFFLIYRQTLNNQGFSIQGLFTPINVQEAKLNRTYRQYNNLSDSYGFLTFDNGQNYVFNTTVAFVGLVKFQYIQTDIHLGKDVSKPHVWVRVLFTNGNVYDVDPTWLDNGAVTYYEKVN